MCIALIVYHVGYCKVVAGHSPAVGRRQLLHYQGIAASLWGHLPYVGHHLVCDCCRYRCPWWRMPTQGNLCPFLWTGRGVPLFLLRLPSPPPTLPPTLPPSLLPPSLLPPSLPLRDRDGRRWHKRHPPPEVRVRRRLIRRQGEGRVDHGKMIVFCASGLDVVRDKG